MHRSTPGCPCRNHSKTGRSSAYTPNLPVGVGPSPRALEAGLDPKALKPETYRILAKDNAVFFVGELDHCKEIHGNPGIASNPTRWALNHVLEKQVGVRWLWPGDLGTYVPKHTDIAIPATDLTYQPKLEQRSLRMLMSRKTKHASQNPAVEKKVRKETVDWAENHLNGNRAPFTFGHNFGHWWEKYSKDHPDYFAELRPGFTQPFPKPGAVKLRLSNPAVIDQIVKEYEEAGRPAYWNLCPNDGSGFDISEATRAWDVPQDQSVVDIMSARGNLTARYVKFWNLIYERLKELNPDVTIVTYAYSSYRNAPSPDRPLKAKAVLQIVDGVEAYKNWEGWSSMGVDLFLRPNWWHQGADAPYLTYEKTAKFLKFGFNNRMLGLDMDSVLGYWATQGINYYLVARLMTQPELTTEEILGEYTSAFGAGAPKIREYLDYWHTLALEYNYAINAAGSEVLQKSRWEQLVKAGKISGSILNGSKYVLPYLYGEDVLAPAIVKLDEAEALIGKSDEEALLRVAFLRKGLDALRATRAQVILGQKLKENPTPELLEEFKKGAIALDQYRESITEEHVVWGEATKRYEGRYHILLRPEALEFNKINLDGM